MNIFRFPEMLVRAFMGLGGAKILKIHPASNGWVVILRDEVDGKEYLGNFVPITSEKFVCPDSVNEFLSLTKEKDHD